MDDGAMTLLIVTALGMGVVLFGVLAQRKSAQRQQELIEVAKENTELLKKALEALKK